MAVNQTAKEERERFIAAFNNTMLKMWHEKIQQLGVIDTGALYRSLLDVETKHNPEATEATLKQQFLQYGIYQDRGTGRETPRGNSGDIGREKRRRPRPWFSKKYFYSVMRIREFMAQSIGEQYIAVVSNALHTIPNS